MFFSARPLAWTALCLSILASSASAAVPDPANSTVPPIIVGDSNGAQIGIGYRVVVRDVFGDPVPLSHVQLIFAGTVRPYTSQPAPAIATCPVIIERNATTVGIAVFVPRLGGFSNSNTIQVRADGVLLANVMARSTDMNADGSTGIIDFNSFRQRYLTNPAAPETDFDQSGVTNVADFNIFRQIYLADVPGTPCP